MQLFDWKWDCEAPTGEQRHNDTTKESVRKPKEQVVIENGQRGTKTMSKRGSKGAINKVNYRLQ